MSTDFDFGKGAHGNTVDYDNEQYVFNVDESADRTHTERSDYSYDDHSRSSHDGDTTSHDGDIDDSYNTTTNIDDSFNHTTTNTTHDADFIDLKDAVSLDIL